MDMQQLLRLGAQAFQSQLGRQIAGSLPIEKIMPALARLLPGSGDSVDLGALIGRMQGGGLADLAQSWLGDGGNREIDEGDVRKLLDDGAISDFSSELGLSESQAIEGLRGALPAMLDKASSGGSLDMLGGAGGLLGGVSKLFGR